MPTYAYECQTCGHDFEEFQSITAGALRKCPSCGKLKLQRLIGPGAGVIFKGGGFYATDYRSPSYKAGKKAEKDGQESGSKDSGSEAGGSDSGKPSTKKADKKTDDS